MKYPFLFDSDCTPSDCVEQKILLKINLFIHKISESCSWTKAKYCFIWISTSIRPGTAPRTACSAPALRGEFMFGKHSTKAPFTIVHWTRALKLLPVTLLHLPSARSFPNGKNSLFVSYCVSKNEFISPRVSLFFLFFGRFPSKRTRHKHNRNGLFRNEIFIPDTFIILLPSLNINFTNAGEVKRGRSLDGRWPSAGY